MTSLIKETIKTSSLYGQRTNLAATASMQSTWARSMLRKGIRRSLPLLVQTFNELQTFTGSMSSTGSCTMSQS